TMGIVPIGKRATTGSLTIGIALHVHVNTIVRSWSGRAKPPASHVSAIRDAGASRRGRGFSRGPRPALQIRLTPEAGGFARPNHPLTRVVTCSWIPRRSVKLWLQHFGRSPTMVRGGLAPGSFDAPW